MMKRYIKYIPLLLTAALLAGCLKDSFEDVPGVGDGFIEVELGLEIEDEGDTMLTRSLSWDQEYHVETVDVLVFEYDDAASGKGRFRYATHGYDIKNTDGSNAKTFKTMLATEYNDGGTVTSLIGKPVFLLVLANSREVWNAKKGSISTNSTFKSVVGKLVFMQQGNWDASENSTQYFPMASLPGGYHTLTGYSKGSDFGKIKLKRAIAAIDIGFNYDGDTPYGFNEFTLEKVVLCNLSDRGLVSNASSYNVSIVPYTPSYQIVDRSYELGTPSRNGIFNEIYLPEMNQVDVDLQRNKHPYVLIGGKYNDTPSWYKILFPTSEVALAEGGTVTVSMTLHRNCRHIFKIDRIDGPGYATREEAEAGEGKDSKLWMNLTVVPFSQRTAPAEIDGPYKFDVSQTEFYLDNDGRYPNFEYDDNVLELYTDHSGGWRVDDVTYEVDPGSNFWLRTDVIRGNPFVQGQLRIQTNYNDTGIGRVGYVHLSAGRWKYKIKIQQGEIIPLSVAPASRTISFWSHRNGATAQNTFAVNGGGTDWTYSVSYLTAWQGGLTVHKTADGRGFYVQCDRNETIAPRKANVTITLGDNSVTVPITQDWADCGIGGVTKPMPFGEVGSGQEYVKTHLFGSNPYDIWRRMFLRDYGPEETWTDVIRGYYESLLLMIPAGENYACWMLENSRNGTYDVWNYGDDIGGPEKIGPYYSYANAPNACPPGWKLPGYHELYGMNFLLFTLELGDVYNNVSESLAWSSWVEDDNTLAGAKHGSDDSQPGWSGWGTVGLFYSSWDGSNHAGLNFPPQTALRIEYSTSSASGYGVGYEVNTNPNSLLTVRCVKDKTYSYE